MDTMNFSTSHLARAANALDAMARNYDLAVEGNVSDSWVAHYIAEAARTRRVALDFHRAAAVQAADDRQVA